MRIAAALACLALSGVAHAQAPHEAAPGEVTPAQLGAVLSFAEEVRLRSLWSLQSECPDEAPATPWFVPRSVTLRVANDNKLFALWDLVANDPASKGDDVGYTHGYLLEIADDRPGLPRLALVLSSDLFTQPIKGAEYTDKATKLRYIPQHFTEEQKYLVRADDRALSKPIYLRVGAGIHVLDSRITDNPLSTGEQQAALHRFMADYTVFPFAQRERVEDGAGLRVGAIGEGRVGVQGRFHQEGAGSLDLVVFTEGGADLSTLPRASQLVATAGGELLLRDLKLPLVGRPQASLKADVTGRAHADGTVLEPRVEAAMGTEAVEAGVEWRAFYGSLPNYVRYNLPSRNKDRKGGNDDVATLFVRVELPDPAQLGR